MKNGKAPTREQKKIMKAHGLVPENWLVVKNLPDSLEVVSRVSLKKVGGKPKTRTISKSLTVIILSLILCPVCLLGLAAYYGVAIEWFMVFASFIAAFIVALVSMDGWERVTELAEKLIRKK